ncbi:SRPBCC family protein [Mesorhizobium sp.]|uniref:SRPBCC family protein n=1 Tax=Mesorhizobium sp. TaxID=1871066 RepID=UPI00257FAA05|nr:SRPBCC family protein [Mesorhizobium sp.]
MTSPPSLRISSAGRQASAGASKDSGEEWTAEDPDGRPIRIRFSRPNEYGVLDHIVFADDKETRNAVRVVPNGTGAEVMFVLLRTPDMTEEIFTADAEAVQRDLNSLKAMLER